MSAKKRVEREIHGRTLELSSLDKVFFPDWIRTLEVEKKDGVNCQVAVQEPATLAYLAEQACLTPHVWPSRVDKPRRPDRVVFDFDDVKPFSRGVAEMLAARYPNDLTTEIRKNERGDRIFVDFLRNEYAQTAVGPYSLRARPGGPVATPLEWDELSSSGMGPRRYTLENIFRRLSRKDDPWKGMDAGAPSIASARTRLEKMR
ncbi:MAG: hypothetical protein ACOCUZ_01670 [bacterium]